MDIVSRLKKYMEFRQIASSQFADTCGIPRPTISQILNGRNKKISDELISKIHASFPELSVLWLMFGEGEMVPTTNNEISSGLKSPHLDFSEAEHTEHELFNNGGYSFKESPAKPSEKFADPFMQTQDNLSFINENISDKESIRQMLSDYDKSSKKINSIVVFYDDNTFQTFNPSL